MEWISLTLTKCDTSKRSKEIEKFSILSTKILFIDKNSTTKQKVVLNNVSIELKQISTYPVIFKFSDLKKIFANISSRTLMKFILEVKSTCKQVYMLPLSIGPELKCDEDSAKPACGSYNNDANINECERNYADGIAKCRCNNSGKYFGNNCQFLNPCLEVIFLLCFLSFFNIINLNTERKKMCPISKKHIFWNKN